MCDTSKSEPLDRQCSVASTSESLYWMGIDHPANGTILPAQVSRAPWSGSSPHCVTVVLEQQCTVKRQCTSVQAAYGLGARHTAMLDMEVVEGGLQQAGLVCECAHALQLAGHRRHPHAMRANAAST